MWHILFVLPDILLFRSVVFPLFYKLHFLVPFYFITFVPTLSLVVNFKRAFPNDITAAMLVPSRIKLYSYTNEPFNFWLLKNDVRGKLTVVFSLSFQPILFLRSVVLHLFLRLQSSFRFYCVDLVKLHRSFFTWRQGGHFDDTAQRKSGHVGLPNSSFEGWTLFLSNNVL